jgi:ectoine hydroxylase-related dioxygenase (phytanoyl-CoA dioxygenase family)
MRDRVWLEITRRHGIERDDRTTWHGESPTGLKGCKRHWAFKATMSARVAEALDQLLGEGRWEPPKHYGQVLVTLPNTSEWRVPHRLWHADFLFIRTTPGLRFAVKHWALLDDVAPGGGGTPQIAGSHVITERYLREHTDEDTEYKWVRDRVMRSHPWLKALATPNNDPGRNARFMGDDVDVDGLPARVVELTGSAGDVFLTHQWVFHTTAANASDRPRMMQTKAIYRRRSPGLTGAM